MASRNRHPVIREFIELYRRHPCLWRVGSREYRDREMKAAAYKILVAKLREMEPDATRSTVVEKINNLRSNIRKEKKKREISLLSGATSENVYKPRLWYYDLFDFLDQDHDQDTLCMYEPTLEDMSGSEDKEEEKPVDLAVEIPTYEVPIELNKNPRKRKPIECTPDVSLAVSDDFLKTPAEDDRYDLLGKSIALRVRALEKRQRLIVEKKINDILFDFEMETLNPGSSECDLSIM